MCKVSSFLDEDFNQKNLIVYVPPARVQFSHSSVEREGQTMVTCSATDIYPSPVARIYWKDGDSEREVDKTEIKENSDGLFTINLSTSFHTESVRGVQLGCEISIPGTDYTIREDLIISADISADPRVSGSSRLQLPTASQLLLLLAATLWQLAAIPTNTQTL